MAKVISTTVIADAAVAPITGRLVVESLAGWDQPITGFEVAVACGAKATETTEVPIPLSLTAGRWPREGSSSPTVPFSRRIRVRSPCR